jgi:hypothetical protein
MTQGKIERYHRTLKNVVTLQNYYLPWELEREVGTFVRRYNHERVHEALKNLTPADVYLGRARNILGAREKLKRQALERRRRYHRGLPARKEELIRPSMFRELSLVSEPDLSQFSRRRTITSTAGSSNTTKRGAPCARRRPSTIRMTSRSADGCTTSLPCRRWAFGPTDVSWTSNDSAMTAGCETLRAPRCIVPRSSMGSGPLP